MTDDSIGKALVLLSGGMDSCTLLYHVARRMGFPSVYAVTFDYGQKHSREIEMAGYHAARMGVAEHAFIDLRSYGNAIAAGTTLVAAGAEIPDHAELTAAQLRQPPTYVPNRNMAMLSIAAAYAESRGIGDVFYGAHEGDTYGYWDCTREFIAALNSVLALNKKFHVTIGAPFAGMSKADIVKIGLELGLDYSYTWTCYRGGTAPCGRCPSCVERRNAFIKAGIRDPYAD